MPGPFVWMLFLLASLLGPRLVAGDERDAPPMLLEDESEAPAGSAIPGVVSEERVVWIEGFGWMGSADLFEGLGVQVDAPGFGEVSGSEESLGVLEAVLSLLAESPGDPDISPPGETLPHEGRNLRAAARGRSPSRPRTATGSPLRRPRPASSPVSRNSRSRARSGCAYAPRSMGPRSRWWAWSGRGISPGRRRWFRPATCRGMTSVS
ncbi:MAG: hypothetical protein VCB99_06070 [Myxococcota bacterium]